MVKVMDFDFGDDDNGGVPDKKASPVGDNKPITEPKHKKKVVIDDRNLNINDEPKPKSDFRLNFETTSIYWRIASGLYLIGYVFYIIAFGTPYWLNTTDAGNDALHVGLWSECHSISDCHFRNGTSGCLSSARGFGAIGLITGLVVCILLLLYIGKPVRRLAISIAVVAMCVITGMCVQISSSVLLRNDGCYEVPVTMPTTVGWSTSLAMMSLVITCMCGVAFLVLEFRYCSFKSRFRKRRDKDLLSMNMT